MRQSGFTLPATLLLLTLMLLLLDSPISGIIQALRFESEQKLSEKAFQQASSMALQSSFEFTAPDNTQIKNRCFTGLAKVKRVDMKVSFCSSFEAAPETLIESAFIEKVNLTPGAFLPSLDFSSIFKNTTTCSAAGGQLVNIAYLPANHRPVNSAVSCHFDTFRSSSRQVISANFIADNLIFNPEAGSLAARGSLRIRNQTVLEGGNISMIAAGDIDLNQIIANQPTRLRLISATGDVSITQTLGTVELQVFAGNKFNGANTFQKSQDGFKDLALNFLPLGFEASS